MLTLHETADDVAPVSGDLTPTVNIYRVRFGPREDSNEEVELDEFSGKLEYLMGQPIIEINGVPTSPINFIQDWFNKNPQFINENESRFDVVFPVGAIVKIPYEPPFETKNIRFHIRLVMASKTSEPMLSRHIREFNALRHELQDCITGEVIYSQQQRSLHIGFDTVIQPGKFYHSTNGFNYYCESVSNDLISWILLESYQHGKFIQAKFIQKISDAKSYVEEYDPPTLRRLKLMLDDFTAHDGS